VSNSPRRAALSLGICTLIASGAAPLQAQSPFTSPSRVSAYNLTFTDFQQFLDASAAYRFTHDVSTGTGVATGLAGHTVTGKSLYSGIYSGFTGNATTSLTYLSGTTYDAPWSTTGGPGSIYYGYDTPVGSTFGESWIVPGIHNGRHTLDFVGGGSGWASPVTGILFKLVVTINGDWSQFGTGFGQVEWLGYTGTGYSVDQLFTYNNGVTTLELSNPDWNRVSPDASFRLYGATVAPEPASIVLVATGLLGLGAMARVRRRRRT